jgi:type I restriction enzyme S subunit
MSQVLPKDVPPTLRRWKLYSAYKDSGVEWLGEIPEHWEITKLGAKCSVKARLGWKGLKASEYVDDGYIFLSTPNIKEKNIDFEDVNYITANRYFESPEIMLEVDDVLIAKDGSTLGIVNVVRSLPAPTTVNSSIAVIRHKKSFDSVFLYYFLASDYTQNVIQRMKDGMGVPHLFQADLRKFTVLTPPIPEQQGIASFLDRETAKIDALIAKKQRLIELLQEKHTVIISHAVTQGLDPTVLLKDSGVDWIGKIPAHWEVRKIKNLCSVVKDGLHETPPKVPEGIPFISTQHVRNRYIDLERATFISKDDYEKGHPRIAPSPGDVLITLVGSIGFAAILKPEFYPISFTRHVGYVRPKSNLTANYLLNYVESSPFRTFLDLEVSQTAQPSIYLRSLAEHVIPVPPVDEQNYIVAHLDRETAKIDALIAKIREGIEKLKEYRTALISAAVTGKIDVRNEVAS